MKYLLFAMAVLLASAGCSKHEVYERNLQFMTQETFQAEKAVAAKQYQEAQNEFAQAQASGDKDRIAKAKSRFLDAQSKYKGIEWEERRRNRP
ncbi:MAG: hypothetical protein ACOZEN_01280 [Thermodesulfobacteriota bacterium]